MSEHDVQKAIVQYLHLVLPDDQCIVGISNNPRSRAVGGREKARGMLAGFPDLLICGRIVGFIEVKIPGQTLRASQRNWRDFCFATGMNWALVRSVEDVAEVITAWGIKPRIKAHF